MAREGDPILGFNFSLTVDGVEGFFTSIDGIGSEHSVAVQKVVTAEGKEMEIKAPGRLSWGDITLKRGLTVDMDFWKWREQVVHGDLKSARKPVTITLYDRNYKPIVRWNLTNAWPSKISGIAISSDSNDFVVEELTITHEGLQREGAEGYPAIPTTG